MNNNEFETSATIEYNRTEQKTNKEMKQCRYCRQMIDKKAKVCPFCQREQSSVAKIIVAFLFSLVVLLLLTAFVFMPLYEETHQNNSNNNSSPASIQKEPAPTEPTTQEVFLLYDENDIKIYYTGLSENDYEVRLNLCIENNTNKNITIQTRDFTINDYTIDCIFSPEIPSGKKANDDISIWRSEFEKNNIDKMLSTEFYFHIFDSDTWDDIDDSQSIKMTW